MESGDIRYIVSKCHGVGWMLFWTGGAFHLGCEKCTRPLGIDLNEMAIGPGVIEERVDDDFTFILPPSRCAWELVVKRNGNASLACAKTHVAYVTATVNLGGAWKCDACGADDIHAVRITGPPGAPD